MTGVTGVPGVVLVGVVAVVEGVRWCRGGRHDLDAPDATYVGPDGGRRCRECRAEASRRYRRRRRVVVRARERVRDASEVRLEQKRVWKRRNS